MDIMRFVFRALHLKPRIQQVLAEADPIVDAFRKAAPELVPLLKVLRRDAVLAWRAAAPVVAAYKRQAPTLLPLAQTLWWELAPELAKELARVQDIVISVAWIQRSLNALGADPKLKVDDDPGPATTEAIKQFQRKYNVASPQQRLKVDGFAGPATLSAIYVALQASSET